MKVSKKPHAVFVPYPAQSHIKSMLKMAKVIHLKGLHITFVNNEFNHKRFLRSRGPNSLDGLPDFNFVTIPDDLPASNNIDAMQDIPALCQSVRNYMITPFRELVAKLNDTASSLVPPVTCIVVDGMMLFGITVAEELGIPSVSFFTFAACGFMGFKQFRPLIDRGITPLKDESYLTNGYLDAIVEIPGMKNMRLRDLPSFMRTTDPNEPIFNCLMEGAEGVVRASALIVHTFDALERDVLDAISSMYPHVYSIGPMQLLLNRIEEESLKSVGYSLWKEETECLQWLDNKNPSSVVYVNFGSITVMSKEHLIEFAMGLANSDQPFLWIIRPDLVIGDSAILPPEFVAKTKEKGYIASWCPQEEVLNHSSIGGFLTHCGWGSVIESISSAVPIICWPFFADQHTNCKYACNEWEIGLEIDNNVKRDEVEKLVRELMEGEKGKKMRKKAMEWKNLAEEAASPNGSSSINLDKLVKEVLLVNI